MTDSIAPDAPSPRAASFTRRRVVRMASGLGLGAASVVAFGMVGTEAAGAPPGDSLAFPGRFGEPPTEKALAAQRRRVVGPTLSRRYVKPGVASTPETTSAAGARLRPSTAVIDKTPLAHRGSGTAWQVKG